MHLSIFHDVYEKIGVKINICFEVYDSKLEEQDEIEILVQKIVLLQKRF